MTIYIFEGHDNDSYAFADSELVARCNQCRGLLERDGESLARLALRRKRMDVSCTYDSVLVISQRFRALYDAEGWQGLDFHPLPGANGFYAVRGNQIVNCDDDGGWVRRSAFCTACQSWGAIAGPICLRGDVELPPNSFARTDVRRGSLTEWGMDERAPLILCGEEVQRTLSRARIVGVELSPVRSREVLEAALVRPNQ